MKPSDYINEVVGKPWQRGADGPSAFDCWGLIIDSFRKIDGIELPSIGEYSVAVADDKMVEALSAQRWHKLEKPKDGCVVCCFVDGSLQHVGRLFYGKMLHSRGGNNGAGEVCVWSILVTKRLYKQVEFYEWR